MNKLYERFLIYQILKNNHDQKNGGKDEKFLKSETLKFVYKYT